MTTTLIHLFLLITVTALTSCTGSETEQYVEMPPQDKVKTEFPDPPGEIPAGDRIMPYKNNPFYWQYKGEPLVLIGGTRDHNAFNQPGTEHPEIEWDLEFSMDRYREAGINFMRNTMTHRDIGNVYPYLRRKDVGYDSSGDNYPDNDNSLFDLRQPNPEYWNRFARFLKMAYERNIIVQVEVWDIHDYFRDTHSYWHPYGGWSKNPFNPKNNINYDSGDSGLPESVEMPPARYSDKIHPFFHTVPELMNLPLALEYQQRFVDKILDLSLPYPNVVYCVHNETLHAYEFGEYWAGYIQRYAAEAGFTAQVGEMRFRHYQFARIIDQPELFDFIDISQNTNFTGDEYWYKLAEIRNRILHTKTRPIQNVKIYGSKIESSWRQNEDETISTFWQLLLGGAASARFHRPPAGIGMVRGETEWSGSDWNGRDWNDLPRSIFKSFHIMRQEIDIFDLEPDTHFRLLANRAPHEAYMAYTPNRQYVLYFPYGGEVLLNMTATDGTFNLQWLNIHKSELTKPETILAGEIISLSTPDTSHWLALITKQ